MREGITARPVKNSPSDEPVSKTAAGVVNVSQILPATVDFYAVLSMVFGGCCTNVWAYEQLLILSPRIGSALTFSQMLFITLHSLPSFLLFNNGYLPRLRPRQVPLPQWGLQVLVLLTGSLLNNWAFAYNVPLTVQIVFRSAGLPISVLFGYFISKKRYAPSQLASVAVVTVGVILATLSRPSSSRSAAAVLTKTPEELRKYVTGISMLVVSLFCTGYLGVLQERTYKIYGPCWKEGVLYTHLLSLPGFLFLGSDVRTGIESLSRSTSNTAIAAYMVLLANLVSQLICVSGVNRLTSQVSSVSTNIVLTTRKALSLCFSVWWFSNQWNSQLILGATLVFLGSGLYTLSVRKEKKQD
ncbi:UAA transporter [Cyathus striatus]|nr:UAA transporter [Cyathus striatus]